MAYAFPVQSLHEVDDRLKELRKLHYDARHHCYAYRINPEADVYRANDDGEPNHSAGDPILGQIKSIELTNTLVVVVRYFGGTKLGVGGLINAYKTATREALENTTVITKNVERKIVLNFSYPATNEVMKLIGKHQVKILSQSFETECKIEATLPLGNLEKLTTEVELLKNTGTELALQS